ncbi:MAG: ABC transporter substrate-binding protein [Ignavibacteriota bacterium]
MQCYTLARRIYTDLGLKRIALLRVNERYGRFGVGKFRDASRRLGHPVVIEQKYAPPDTSFTRQLQVINDSRVDGIVIWGDAAAAGTILKEMRQMGMKQPVFGSFRVLGDDLFRNAGEAAEGLEIVYPFDPTRDDPKWVDFQKRFAAASSGSIFRSVSPRPTKPRPTHSPLWLRHHEHPVGCHCRAGLNRGKIRDALYSLESYHGVTGEMTFDPNAKNVAPCISAK